MYIVGKHKKRIIFFLNRKYTNNTLQSNQMQINNDGNTVSQAADIPVQLNVNVPSVSYRSCYFHNLSFSPII